jgi:hypothetical protein
MDMFGSLQSEVLWYPLCMCVWIDRRGLDDGKYMILLEFYCKSQTKGYQSLELTICSRD